jgi:two-component system, OmpR family, sensor histidine kinase BaeS
MRRTRSLAARLAVGQALVILAGAASLGFVATAVAPGIFHRHVRDALGNVPPGELAHLDHAFQDTLLIALGVAIAVAAVTALAISLLLAARIAEPIRRLAAAAERVARGERGVRLSLAGADELRTVSASFNAMAATLERAETQRREFVSDIAHELRTPVATIDGYLEGLADGVVEPDPATWRMLRDQTARMRRLVDDLATLARADEGRIDLRIERLDLADVLQHAAGAARAAYDDKRVHLAINSESTALDADPDRLAEILANLLANALRHTPAGGAVTITGSSTLDHVRVAVEDTGEGIPPDELDRIFERFHRVDPSRSRATGGSGLGLAISRALVHAHGGTIRADSRGAGHGTRIEIDLPTAR